MIHFRADKLSIGLLFISILAILSMAFPAMAQPKSPVKERSEIHRQKAAPASAPTAPAATPAASSGANLKFTAFSASTAQIQAGSSLTVSAIVKNSGKRSSGRYVVKFYIAKNRTGKSRASRLASMPGVTLARNATKTFERSITIPENQSPGSWWLVTKVEQPGSRPVKDSKAKRITVISASAPAPAPAISPMASNPNRPRIRSVTPTPVATGRSVTISGDRFGPRQGTVELGFADRDVPEPLDVTQWSNRRIVARVSESTDGLVPPDNSAVMLWVKPDGFEEHSLRDGKFIRLVSGLIPRIVTLSSRTILPGQEITLHGEHFLDRSPGQVRFIFSGHSFDGYVKPGNWEENRIIVSLPETVSGLTSTDGHVEVENFRGRSSRHGIVFLPNLETKRFVESVWHHYRSSAAVGEYGSKTKKEFILLSITHRRPTYLLNDWVIKSIDLRKTSGPGSCSLEPPVSAGSSSLPNFIKIRVNKPFSDVYCQFTLEIHGPAGTDPF